MGNLTTKTTRFVKVQGLPLSIQRIAAIRMNFLTSRISGVRSNRDSVALASIFALIFGSGGSSIKTQFDFEALSNTGNINFGVKQLQNRERSFIFYLQNLSTRDLRDSHMCW